MAWLSVAICDVCWERRCIDRGEPGRTPVRVTDRIDKCGYCGDRAHGIYVRDQDSNVTYFSEEGADDAS